MSRSLEGQTAWISGAASGIGEAVARLFAAEGANVVLVDVDRDRAEAVRLAIAEAGGRALVVPTDVASEEGVRESIARAIAEFGGLDIVVNCAGIVHVGPLHEYDEAEWDRLMGVNLKSIFFSVKHGLPHLRRNPRSYVVNIGSISSFVGQASTPAYTASKGGRAGADADRSRWITPRSACGATASARGSPTRRCSAITSTSDGRSGGRAGQPAAPRPAEGRR